MGSSDAAPLPVALLQSLLGEAGVHEPPESLSLLGVSTCSVWALTVADRRYVLRHRLDGDMQLAHKELYLSTLLHRHGVTAPHVLAMVSGEHGTATLSSWLPGIRLDQAMEQLSAPDLRHAWHSVGAALRLAHEIVLPVAGELIGDRVEPFPGGWSTWVMEGVHDDIRWLEAHLGSPPVAQSLLERLVVGAIDMLAEVPVRLVHNDALPQNIMVAPGPDGWECTGWLDWEFARAGDPLWDLSTLDFRPAALVPASFYAGYGVQPAEPYTSIYELLMATWRTRAELEQGFSWTWPPQPTRLAYIHSLPDRTERLAELLGV